MPPSADEAPDPAAARVRPAIVALASIAFIASQANLLRIVGPLTPSILALQLAFTPDAFTDVLSRWGEAGIARYREHFACDMAHPFIYGALGVAWVRWSGLFAALPSWRRRAWTVALPVAGACDLVENALHWTLLGSAGAITAFPVALAATAASVKWGLAVLFAAGLVRRLVAAAFASAASRV